MVILTESFILCVGGKDVYITRHVIEFLVQS